eukprot:scaffold788_cov231-Pinguiococcus_pyrenoidosus.AAC.4
MKLLDSLSRCHVYTFTGLQDSVATFFWVDVRSRYDENENENESFAPLSLELGISKSVLFGFRFPLFAFHAFHFSSDFRFLHVGHQIRNHSA